MASPVTTQAVRPLDTLRFDASGPPQLMTVVSEHLRLLGAQPADTAPGTGSAGRTVLSGEDFAPVQARATWASSGPGSPTRPPCRPPPAS